MKNENGAALLAQDDSKAKNHTRILQAFDAAVKVHDLKSALGMLEMKPQDTVELMRGMFPSFDKTVLSKCNKPEKYGCVLHPAGYDVLRSMAAEAEETSQQETPPEPQKPKKRFRHKLTRQVSGRLSERKYEALQHYIRLDGYETTQDWVTAQVDNYIGRMIEKYGNPGSPDHSEP